MQETRRGSVTLVLGGVRSGKSRYAQQLAEQSHRVVFVATARNSDDEMRRKIVSCGFVLPWVRDVSTASTSAITIGNTPAAGDLVSLKVTRKTGTDNIPVQMMSGMAAAPAHHASPDYSGLDTPAVWRSSRESASAHVAALQEKGVDTYDIPAFLRKQAD